MTDLYWEIFTDMIKGIPGDIVECGVGRGVSLIKIGKINRDRIIFGYDSFLGFPEPTPEDNSKRNPKKGEWSKSLDGTFDYTKQYVSDILAAEGLGNIILVDGFFDKTLNDHPDRPIALLHVDGDLYQSHKVILENLFGLVSCGGLVIFDDVYKDKSECPFPGAYKAVKEFLGDRFDDMKKSISGNYYYVKP